MRKTRSKKLNILFLGIVSLLLTACKTGEVGETGITQVDTASMQETENSGTVSPGGEVRMEIEEMEKLFDGQKMADFYKGILDTNPIMTQRFGADPYAMVYGDEVYFYMTSDTYEYDANGEIKENSYGKINTISVVSTKDMINFTDHGEIPVAGKNGVATWANNSWAPAAAWKNIDGKDQFFLYFADGGGGIGVLRADTPYGPFEDPIGHGLITRNTPTCDRVLWLFDPAILMDDNGEAYIYCGGGVPEGKVSDPGTGRVAKLGADMISLDGDPVPLDVPYLFEDSGAHKFGNKYYYTYCTNFQVDSEGTAKYGFSSGEISVLVSDDPMGPFVYQERILRNPGSVFGLSGNNHHCVFCFKDQWYITYHTRVLEQKIGVEKGYRCTSVTPFEMKEDGTIGLIPMTLKDREAVASISAFDEQNATTSSLIAGVNTAAVAQEEVGTWCVSNVHSGGFVKVAGVDFGDGSAKKLSVSVRDEAQGTGSYGIAVSNIATGNEADDAKAQVIQVRIDSLKGQVLGYVDVQAANLKEKQGFVTIESDLISEVSGSHDLYFIYSGTGYEVLNWQFQ